MTPEKFLLSLKGLTEKTELKSSVRVSTVRVTGGPFYTDKLWTKRTSPMCKLIEIVKFEYNIDLLWSWSTFGWILEVQRSGIVPEKAPFCSSPNFTKSDFDQQSTQNSKRDGLLNCLIQSPDGHPISSQSSLSEIPGVSCHAPGFGTRLVRGLGELIRFSY